MTQHRRAQFIFVAGIVLVVVAGGLFLWKALIGTSVWWEKEKSRQVAETSRTLAQSERVPITETSTVIETLRSATAHTVGEPPEQSVQDALLTMVTQWLQLRHAGDVDAYSEWMQSRGWRLRWTIDEREPEFTPEDERFIYRAYTGKELEGDIDPEELFRICFEASLARHGRENRPVAIGKQHNAVLYGTLAQTRRIITEAFNGIDSEVINGKPWVGGGVGRTHWMPLITIDDVIARDGEALVGEVRIVYEGGAGKWLPLRILCYYDPDLRQWNLYAVVMSNAFLAGIDY